MDRPGPAPPGPTTLRRARRASRWLAAGVLVALAAAPLTAQSSATFRPLIRALVSIPDSGDDFARMYGRRALDGEWSAIRRSQDAISGSFPYLERVRSEFQLLSAIEADGANTIVLIGHNEGGVFRLPTGEAIHLARVGDHASRHGKRVVFASCHASCYAAPPHLGTSGALTYDQALEIMSRVVGAVDGVPVSALARHGRGAGIPAFGAQRPLSAYEEGRRRFQEAIRSTVAEGRTFEDEVAFRLELERVLSDAERSAGLDYKVIHIDRRAAAGVGGGGAVLVHFYLKERRAGRGR